MIDGFLGIGFWEILLVFVIVMALLGPRRLPEIAGKLGTLMRRLKGAFSDLTTAVTNEVEGTPVKQGENPLDGLKKAAIDLKSSLTRKVEDAPTKEVDSLQVEGKEPKAHD
jgi:sec-independent protein translocase protein TatB